MGGAEGAGDGWNAASHSGLDAATGRVATGASSDRGNQWAEVGESSGLQFDFEQRAATGTDAATAGRAAAGPTALEHRETMIGRESS